ncbi:MAG: GAF domain-containing protein [Myxococcota bacterium]|nr:GAF domain-containing protein [Myxococcota bacterium]
MSNAGQNVLIIDDEQAYRENMGAILRGAGLAVQSAESMQVAREKAGVTPPSLVLLDLDLPGSDGLANLGEWLGMQAPPHVIVLSEASAQGQVLEALRRGAADYLAKPLHEEEFLISVRRGLKAWSVSRDLRSLEGRVEALASRSGSLLCEAEEEMAPAAADEVIRQGVVEMACEALGAKRASLLVLDSAGEHLVLVNRAGENAAPEEVEPIASEKGVCGFVFARAKPTLVTDMRAEPDLAPWLREDRYESTSFVAVPIFKAGAVAAILFVTEPLGRAGFGKADLALLQWAAQPLAETLRSASALASVEERVSESMPSALTAGVLPKPDSDEELELETEMAREICQAVADEVDPARVLSVALGRLGALLPAAPISLYLVDSATGQLHCEASLDGGVCEDRTELRPRRGLTGVVVQTGQLVASDDPAADPRFDPEIDTPLSGTAQPMMCLPLRLRGKVVGLLRAFLPEGEPVSPRTAEVLAAVLSAALRSVLLYRSLVESIEEVAEARRDTRG